MEAKYWRWQLIKKLLWVIVVITVLITATLLMVIEVRSFGTGFTGKTLWDWLGLIATLAVPVVVGFGAAWFTSQQAKVADAENKDNQRENALQSYIDKISELLLKENLRESGPEKEVQKIARVRTLTVLQLLDSKRKRSLLQFLYEARLLEKGKPIIDLRGADLRFTNLSGVDLRFADLSGVDFTGADFTGADLREANLMGATLVRAILREVNMSDAWMGGANLQQAFLYKAYLHGANLSGTNLSGANLKEALMFEVSLIASNVTSKQWEKAHSLKGATMPDGSIYP